MSEPHLSGPDPDANAAALHHARALRVVTGVMLCVLLSALDQTVVVPAVPAIAADLNGFGHLSWIVTAYLLTCTSCTPVYGKLSDLYGRRVVLLSALALFLVASALCGMATGMTTLIVLRAAQGVGGGGLLAVSQAAIADVVSPRERGRYQAYLSGMWALASISGPLVGGWLADALSWRWIFWLNLPLGAAAYLLSARALKILPQARRAARIDYRGAVLLMGANTAALLALSWGGVIWPWLSTPVLGAAAAAAVLLGLLVLSQLHAVEPLMPPRLFANPVYVCGVAIGSLASGAILGMVFLLPLAFQLLRGADAAASGGMLTPFLIANVAGAYSAGQAAHRLGRMRPVVVCGLLVAAPGLAVLAWLGGTAPWGELMAAMVVASIGLGACMPASLVIAQNAADHRDVGAGTGVLVLMRNLGGAFGTALVGTVLAQGFARSLGALGGNGLDLGALRGPTALAGLDPHLATLAREALAASFTWAFATCALLAALALVAALVMPDTPLRTDAG